VVTGQYAGRVAIERVGVIGSGIMGSGIAEVAAASGCEVIVRSRSQATADGMVAVLEKSLARQVEREKRTAEDAAAILARVRGTGELEELEGCDLVIESVVEDLSVKKALFGELDRLVKREAILATNTSTLPVVEMAMETSRPEQVCGIHFFNPATAMRLVEVSSRSPLPMPPSPRSTSSSRRAARRPSRSRTAPASSSTRCCSRT